MNINTKENNTVCFYLLLNFLPLSRTPFFKGGAFLGERALRGSLTATGLRQPRPGKPRVVGSTHVRLQCKRRCLETGVRAAAGEEEVADSLSAPQCLSLAGGAAGPHGGVRMPGSGPCPPGLPQVPAHDDRCSCGGSNTIPGHHNPMAALKRLDKGSQRTLCS